VESRFSSVQQEVDEAVFARLLKVVAEGVERAVGNGQCGAPG
jgi:hypothetical protein